MSDLAGLQRDLVTAKFGPRPSRKPLRQWHFPPNRARIARNIALSRCNVRT
jgi:hypothetical protein